jgi:hypothetical protein
MQFPQQTPFPPGSAPWEVVPPQVFVLVAVAAVVGAVLIIGPLVRAIARRIEGGGGNKEIKEELVALNSRLDSMEQEAITSGEVDASVQRLYEVEERLDFVERVMSRPEGEARK